MASPPGKPKEYSTMTSDLFAATQGIRCGAASSQALLDACLAAAGGEACAHAFTRRFALPAALPSAALPLAGLAVSVKALFDVAGQPTTAASRALADAPPA